MEHQFKKNVLLFKYEDLRRRNGEVYTPHLMGMANLRKSEQFKKGVVFADSMSESDVKRILEEVFPLLRNRR